MLKMIKKETLVFWVQKNFKAMLLAGALFLFAGLGAIVFKSQREKAENEAAVALYGLKKNLEELAPKEEPQKDLLSQMEKDSEELKPTDEMLARAKAYEQSIRDNEKFKISAFFAIDLAHFYYRFGKKEKALPLLSLFARPVEKSALYQLASFQLAGYHMNDSKCERALPLLEGLISNEAAQPFHSESRLQKGICLEFMKRYPEALEQYKRLSLKNPDSYLGRRAKDYERLLTLKQKLEQKKRGLKK